MTVDELIDQARDESTGRVAPMTPETLESVLRLTLEHLLENVDVEAAPGSVPAQIARVLAVTLVGVQEWVRLSDAALEDPPPSH